MSAPADIDVRPVTEAEYPEWLRAVHVGFLREPVVSKSELEARRAQFEPGRLLGAFDGDRCVATFRSFAQEVTAVGGEFVAADAISAVTVTATHRRRGLLTRMMSQDLAAAKERGDVLATLIAAEYPIYGRYGFGPATSAAEWTIDVPRTGLAPVARIWTAAVSTWWSPATYASSGRNCTTGCAVRCRGRSAGTTGSGSSRRGPYAPPRGPSRSSPCTGRRTARSRG